MAHNSTLRVMSKQREQVKIVLLLQITKALNINLNLDPLLLLSQSQSVEQLLLDFGFPQCSRDQRLSHPQHQNASYRFGGSRIKVNIHLLINCHGYVNSFIFIIQLSHFKIFADGQLLSFSHCVNPSLEFLKKW